MSLLSKVYDLLFRVKFSNVPNRFVSKDGLFGLTFDESWMYSKKGNSFYSFHNLKEDLKGELQFSISWNVSPPESIDERKAVLNLVEKNENEKVDFQETLISNYQAIHYRKSYADSNMNFCYWYIYTEKILIVITFMIYQGEPENVKNKWIKRVASIINTLELDVSKFQTTRMK